VSTDFEEVATVCTRVLVFRDGLIAAELTDAEITVERLLAMAAGGALHADTQHTEEVFA
jgi:ribose transport system ATP-binding protein